MGDHGIQRTFYNGIALPLSYGAVRVAAAFHGKLRRAVRGRRAIRTRWSAAKNQVRGRPVWFHVSSVGEYEQARPLITTLNVGHPGIPVALTVMSPSGYDYISRKETVHVSGEETDGEKKNLRFMDYLPFDFAGNAQFCLATLDPRLLVFVKFDLWPNLVWEAAKRGTPMVLVDATLSEASRRNSFAGRRFYRSVYSEIAKILAISDADAQRFLECVPDHPGISTVGDTRFDRVMDRKRNPRGLKPSVRKNGRLTIVAGSTWPKDEIHLLGALARVARAHPDVLLVIAPHEPTPNRLATLLSWAQSERLGASLLSRHGETAERGDAERVVIVDSVGVLAEIYEYGDAAYVGGSFSTGVHSVIEPAVMGIPVAFGPVHHNSFEAVELLRFNAAIETGNENEIFDALDGWVNNPSMRAEMGANARRYVESQLGATERCMKAMSEYL
jgi:3-deoxy-D-manno-octulosonic-acid transferase